MKLKTRAQVKVARHAQLAAELVNGPLAAFGVEEVHPMRGRVAIHVAQGQIGAAGHAIWNNRAPGTKDLLFFYVKRGVVDGVAVDLVEAKP